MLKKNIALCVFIVTANFMHADTGYPAEFGRQVDGNERHHKYHGKEHHKHLNNETARRDDELRLAQLAEEESNAYSHTNLAWSGVAIGTIIAVLGVHSGDIRLIAGGAVLAGASGTAGLSARAGENHRARERREEREAIKNRLYSQS
jgi:hypothetical protein